MRQFRICPKWAKITERAPDLPDKTQRLQLLRERHRQLLERQIDIVIQETESALDDMEPEAESRLLDNPGVQERD
jgi:hypothetical protein